MRNALKDLYVRTYPKDPADGDGQPVELYTCRMPAEFTTLKALPSENSVGKPIPGWKLSTGSGTRMRKLAEAIAEAAAEGMIGIDPD